MKTPRTKNPTPTRVHVTLTDAKTRKSKGFTLYGVTTAQAERSIKRGLELLAQKEQRKDDTDTEANAA